MALINRTFSERIIKQRDRMVDRVEHIKHVVYAIVARRTGVRDIMYGRLTVSDIVFLVRWIDRLLGSLYT